jgi:hypothetical protein
VPSDQDRILAEVRRYVDDRYTARETALRAVQDMSSRAQEDMRRHGFDPRDDLDARIDWGPEPQPSPDLSFGDLLRVHHFGFSQTVVEVSTAAGVGVVSTLASDALKQLLKQSRKYLPGAKSRRKQNNPETESIEELVRHLAICAFREQCRRCALRVPRYANCVVTLSVMRGEVLARVESRNGKTKGEVAFSCLGITTAVVHKGISRPRHPSK